MVHTMNNIVANGNDNIVQRYGKKGQPENKIKKILFHKPRIDTGRGRWPSQRAIKRPARRCSCGENKESPGVKHSHPRCPQSAVRSSIVLKHRHRDFSSISIQDTVYIFKLAGVESRVSLATDTNPHPQATSHKGKKT